MASEEQYTFIRGSGDGKVTTLNRQLRLQQEHEPHDYGDEVAAEIMAELAELAVLGREGWQPSGHVPDDEDELSFEAYAYKVPERKRFILPWPAAVTRSRLGDFCHEPGNVVWRGEQVPLPGLEPPADDAWRFPLAGFHVELIGAGAQTELVLTNATGRGHVYSLKLLEWLEGVSAEAKEEAEKQGKWPVESVDLMEHSEEEPEQLTKPERGVLEVVQELREEGTKITRGIIAERLMRRRIYGKTEGEPYSDRQITRFLNALRDKGYGGDIE